MFENVAEHLDEAVRLAERCPEKYRIPCFQALIDVLARSDSPTYDRDHLLNGNGEEPTFQSNDSPTNSSLMPLQDPNGRGSIFLDRYQIPGDCISRVYHLDGGSYRIIAKDLKEKTVSKKQIKLALLLGVGGLLAWGEPVFSKERLIETCREYGAYDSPNFASHMRKQRDMFVAQGNEWSLTVPAQQRAAEAIKDLAS